MNVGGFFSLFDRYVKVVLIVRVGMLSWLCIVEMNVFWCG